MDFLLDTYKKTGELHHAYSIEGERETVKNNLLHFLEKKVAIETKGNPDFWYEAFDTFTIDDSRALADRQKNKSFDGGKKIFITAFSNITHEAQNSLLKIFEEPTPGTHFFVIIPRASILLPTVRSRMIHIVHTDEKTDHTRAKDFLKMSYKKRLECVQPLIEEKDKAGGLEFLSGLEKAMAKQKPIQSFSPEEIKALEQVMESESYLLDRSPSLKMILEHISLVI
jgi:hypothetical protein